MFLLFALIIIIILIFICCFLFALHRDSMFRIQLTNTINSLTIIFIAIFFYYIDKPQYIDISILYALLSYATILVCRRFFDKLL